MSSPETNPEVRGILNILYDATTPLGELILRRRYSLALEQDVYEMTIDGKLMMSSVNTRSEQQLASKALGMLPDRPLNVLIGGLGFGFTAIAALSDQRVASLTIVERLPEVIQWHRDEMLPWSTALVNSPKVEMVEGDFFEVVSAGQSRSQAYDAILIDIDDSPTEVWHAKHYEFYQAASIAAVSQRLVADGVLGLWFADRPSAAFLQLLKDKFVVQESAAVEYTDVGVDEQQTHFVVLAAVPKASP